MNADGSGQTQLPTGALDGLRHPTWSPDGTRIAFAYVGADTIWVVDSDGTDLATIPLEYQCGPEDEFSTPTWSPDGTEMLVQMLTYSGCTDHELALACVHRIDTGQRLNCVESPWDGKGGWLEPPHDWSPDSTRIVWSNGSLDRLLDEESYLPGPVGGNVHLSPDARKIVTGGFGELLVADADGTNSEVIDSGPDPDDPDWQPIPVNSYPRPRAAVLQQVSLVPAYRACTAPNRTHGPPLAYDSCNPPAQTSDEATLGTPDANGKPLRGEGKARYATLAGDVRIELEVADVYDRSTLTDYTGELRLHSLLRITDKRNTPHPGGPGAGTVSDTILGATAPCTATADPNQGASCVVSTMANALAPGTVSTGARTVWGLGQTRVDDGGADGDADTLGDNTLFMVQGVFVP
jgi:hypothetical protein